MNNLEKIGIEELKKIQMEILDYVSKFCEENEIKYWLDSGTLLGAIRHKGYIPWDDDIDLGMLRPDYDKFMSLFNERSDRYKFYSIENNKNFDYPFGKVIDTTTILYEPDMKYGRKLGVNIDIFVYDNAPEDNAEIEKMFKKRDLFTKFYVVKNYPFFVSKSTIFQKMFRFIGYYILKILPTGFFSRKIINNSLKYKNSDTKLIGNFTAYSKVVAEKELFLTTIKVTFEGKKYNAPIGYDKWLRLFYGDYMQLPPEEKRISTHKFVAFKEKSE